MPISKWKDVQEFYQLSLCPSDMVDKQFRCQVGKAQTPRYGSCVVNSVQVW